ncbi:hypothetical protein [Mucilaginibacter boryungensis]|uniref:Tetratricopeptide repeat protein n=1 Tax=Mucilaginibacter boryungensis TaxID=768480 RepID=A0ABR9XBP8_9SPHI|nr:hypothetical protein [Mucilaginibacter boryungensis]MBE9664763.1 hypothetical protein [Mucilaginibacter boryungensis]
MDEYLNNRQKEIIEKLLANPADNGAAYASNLQELVKTYPQSGLFRALYGRALNQGNPAVAAAYFDGRALYKLMHQNDSLLTVDKAQLIIQGESQPLNGQTASSSSDTVVSEESSNAIFTDQPTAFPNVEWPGQQEDEKKDEAPEQVIEDEYPAPEPAVEDSPEPVQFEDNITPAPVDDEPLGRAPWEMEDEEDEPHIAETPAEFAPWQAEEQSHEEIAPEPLLDHVEEPTELTGEEETYIPQNTTEQYAQWQPEPATEAAPLAWETTEEYQAPTEEPAQWPPYAEEGETVIDEETYDEITAIDDIAIDHHENEVADEQPATYGNWVEEEQSPIVPVEHAYEEPYGETEEETSPAQHDEAEKLIMGNIAATDYFTFDRAFGDNKKPEEPAQPDFYATPQDVTPHEPQTAYKQPTQNNVSRYHDEKMPYTFMWWLDKTRKEHGSLYQPYVKAPANPVNKTAPNKPADKAPMPDELQQQYFENIFHLSSVDELTSNADAPTVEFNMQSKEDRIIQRFIAEDPHIHPPVGEKLDSENKAKKSSEDNHDMVTETLARIYADQMLYPKAIATYKKLMLKYPEKSRYFASRIENLEKKTN